MLGSGACSRRAYSWMLERGTPRSSATCRAVSSGSLSSTRSGTASTPATTSAQRWAGRHHRRRHQPWRQRARQPDSPTATPSPASARRHRGGRRATHRRAAAGQAQAPTETRPRIAKRSARRLIPSRGRRWRRVPPPTLNLLLGQRPACGQRTASRRTARRGVARRSRARAFGANSIATAVRRPSRAEDAIGPPAAVPLRPAI